MNGDHEYAHQSWRKILDPENLKVNLVRASVYLASYEMLKSTVIENPRRFLNMELPTIEKDSPEYKAEIIALYPKDRFHASCLWFKEMKAIDDDDVTVIDEIRRHRNDIAHELPKYIADSRFAVNMQLLDSIHFMVGKIERWWIREIEMGVNSDFDHVDPDTIPDSEIRGGNLIMMDLIHKIIHGQDQELQQLLEIFQKLWGGKQGGASQPGEDDD